MLTFISVIIIIINISVFYLKDGTFHQKLYISRFNEDYICNKNNKSNNILLRYPNVLNFINRFRGGGVLYREDNDESYGLNLAATLQKDGYKVLYCTVPKNVKFYSWFSSKFKNIFWWSDNKPWHLLYQSNIIVILDNYDNMLDIYDFDDRSGYTSNIAVIEASNELLFKPIFIVSRKEYANEILQYNGHTKYYNLITDRFYTLL